MKPLLAVLLLLLTCAAGATDALILISPDAAGPVSAKYGEWTLWPAEDEPGGGNRMLSLLTGIDWAGGSNALVFAYKDGRYLSSSLTKLQSMGYFAARDRIVQGASFAVGRRDGFASPISLLLALDGRSPQVIPLTLRDPWPPGVALAQVDSWDTVAAIVHKAGGRVLVVEYPPLAGERWSRYWLRGEGWGNRLPVWRPWDVPGLIPASQTGALLLHPNRFGWIENDSGNWGGASLWLAYVNYSAPLTLAILGFLAAFFAGCTIYLVSIEERARFASAVLKYLTLLPATILIAGRLTAILGPSDFPLLTFFSFLSLMFGSQILGGIVRKVFPETHEMFAVMTVGFLATLASAPLWSMYSNVLGPNPLPLSPEAAGALFGYLVGVCAFGRGSSTARWIGRISAILCLGWGIAINPWWVANQWPFALLPLVALLIGERLFRLWMLPFFAALPLADGRLIRYGFVWAPGNLFHSYSQSGGVNLARHAEFFVSHGFLGTLIIAGGLAIFVERYLFHEMRRTLLRDSRTKALFQASMACGAMGLFQPLLLYVALLCFVGGTFVLLTDTARAV
ncbi:MAG TPA: hypothetical protein VHE55_15570 [Fimbriimonadaceae bacterium]|nr:hypothetical protein [Fimbriimonadaceae bacterium]